ncbi:MAG: acyltransferase [Erysipelotrichaceae bacterium]|nr:acyltransferase [Erysipelotrichaceae bacterium]
MKKIELIDFLKGASIFAIVIMHFIITFKNYFNPLLVKASLYGGAGVHVFIVCSGIGLALSYKKNPIIFFSFIKKRVKKIYIPYIIVVFFSFLCGFMYKGEDQLLALSSHIFLFKMFIEKYDTSFGSQFWFISTIFQLYLIFIPLMKLVKKTSIKKVFVFSIFISILWWCFLGFNNLSNIRIYSGFFLQYFWEFVLGVYIGYDLDNIKYYTANNIIILVIFLLCTLLYGISGFIGGNLKMFNDVFSLLSFGSILILIYNLKNTSINKFFIRISSYSYEWYLVHILVFESLIYYFGLSIFSFVVAVPLSMLVAYFYNNFIMSLRKDTGK